MSNEPQYNILLIEDSPPLARVYEQYLAKEPYKVSHVDTGKSALQAISKHTPDVIILDLKLPDMDGLDILYYVQEQGIKCVVIVITAFGSVSTAVEAMKGGAADFILKPFNADRLIYTLRNSLNFQKLEKIVDSYKESFDRREYCGFIGSSLPMQSVYQIIESASSSKATVFITGESGTGKELCAEAVHSKSPRSEKPFIALNCAAIPKDLMESEVFGHVKGAFTGAVANRQGAASLADGGTLFLDEICEMDLALQAKLLRFIQTGTFQMVGGNKLEKVDVRFVCASNRDPWAEVEAERFREDLYFRLHVIPVHLPPLHDRGDDVFAIAKQILNDCSGEEGKSFTGFDDDAIQIMANYSWPGNIRQLQNVIRNVVVLNDSDIISSDMLSSVLERSGSPHSKSKSNNQKEISALILKPMSEVEMDYIQEAMRITDSSVTKAASILELSPSTLYRRLREVGEEE